MSKLSRVSFLLVSLLASSLVFADSSKPADAIVSEAKAEASRQHKMVFLIFGASWCGYCHRLDAYLDSAEVRPVIERYFVVARVNAMEKLGKHPERNSPGADELLKKLGGGDGVPFFVFIDQNGSVIVDSNAPKTGSIGFPVEPGEIAWFMKMFGKAVPNMTAEELKTLEAPLHRVPASAPH